MPDRVTRLERPKGAKGEAKRLKGRPTRSRRLQVIIIADLEREKVERGEGEVASNILAGKHHAKKVSMRINEDECDECGDYD